MAATERTERPRRRSCLASAPESFRGPDAQRRHAGPAASPRYSGRRAGHAFRGQREDLDEMLGNLLDNACKWARSRVRLTCSKVGEQVVISIDDDGPGIEPSMREAVLRRGVRADEAAQGSGLGLAIVRDLAEIYGGSISLEESPMGGARARLTLPAQDMV
ncbi:MAG TPA: ATP-binding protein [Blastocatellia bacterium]